LNDKLKLARELKARQELLKTKNDDDCDNFLSLPRFQRLAETCGVPALLPKTTDRVGIIGSGPAGLHMAYRLIKSGYTNVTLFEKEPELGGKSFTRGDIQGTPQEFGTCYTVPYKYQELRVIAQDIGNTQFLEVPVPERYIFENHTDTEAQMQFDWILNAKRSHFPFNVLPPWVAKLSFGWDVERYIRHNNELFSKSLDEVFAKTNKPFKQYLDENGFKDLTALISLANTVQGYGFVDDLPAFYGLWWNDAAIFQGFVATALHLVPEPASILRHGFTQYWEFLWDYLKNQGGVSLKTNCPIKSITRTADVVNLTDSTGQVHELDFVVLASNLKEAVDLLDVTADERETLDSLKIRSNLITTLFECDHTVDPVPLSSWTSTLEPANRMRLMTVRNSEKIFDPEDIVKQTKDFLISYQYNDVAREDTQEYREELARILLEDLNAAGFKNVKIHDQKVWPYFQRWDQDGLNRGMFTKLMGMQGSNRTFYAGASVLFESVQDCMTVNNILVNKIFCSHST